MPHTPDKPLEPREGISASLPPASLSIQASSPCPEGALITECGLGVVHVNGDDAEAFLQSQLTCDISTLKVKAATHAGWCNPKGRLLATLLVVRSGSGFILLLPENSIESVITRLRIYVLRARVVVEQAPLSTKVVELCGSPFIRKLKHHLDTLDSACEMTLHDYPFQQERALLIGSAESIETLWNGVNPPTLIADTNLHHWLNIHHGVPEISHTTSELFVPQEVNLDLIGAVSFTKGCYPGQEIVARMRYRGKLKRRMFSGHIDISSLHHANYPRAGDTARTTGGEQKKVGTLVETAFTANKGMDLLAVLPSQSKPGSQYSLGVGVGPIVTLHPLPYSMGESS